MRRFQIQYPEGRIEIFYFEEKTILLGRAPLVNDIQIDHPSVSRQHAQIKQTKAGIQIKDLESRNGLFFQDEPVEKADLKDEEEIFLGDIKLKVSYVEDSLKDSIDSKVLSTQEVESHLETEAMEKELSVQTHEDARKLSDDD